MMKLFVAKMTISNSSVQRYEMWKLTTGHHKSRQITIPSTGGTLALLINGLEVFGKLLRFELQRSPGYQRRAKPLHARKYKMHQNGHPPYSPEEQLQNTPCDEICDRLVMPDAYRCASGKDTVKHVTPKSHTHHQVHCIAVKHTEHSWINNGETGQLSKKSEEKDINDT